MDLTAALAAHADWKIKLRHAINARATADAESLSRDDGCNFGKGLRGKAKRNYGPMPIHADCISNHAAFHKEAGKVAMAIAQKRYPQAEAALALGSSYHKASTAVRVSII